MIQFNKMVRDAIKAQGDNAPAHFGFRRGTLENYMKKGMYPAKLIQQIQSERESSGAESVPMPSASSNDSPSNEVPTAPGALSPKTIQPEFLNTSSRSDDTRRRAAPSGTGDDRSADARFTNIENYLKNTVDFFMKEIMDRLAKLDQTVGQLHVEHMRHLGVPSLARPAQNVPVDQTFTTHPSGNSWDTGIAPTKAMVDAQANMTTLEGVPIPNATVAGPAAAPPNQPAFGFNWNKSRPR